MKKSHILSSLLLLLAISACNQQNKLKYKGELPKGNFVMLTAEGGDITTKPINDIPLHNRVYVLVDSIGNTLLNGHLMSVDSLFEKNLKYILTNPDKSKHLPERINKTVLCTNLNMLITEKNNQKKILKMTAVRTSISKVIQEIVQEYSQIIFQKEPNQLTPKENDSLAQKLNTRIAYLDEPIEEKGIEVKLPPWSEEEPNLKKSNAHNIWSVRVNSDNELFVRDKPMNINDLKEATKRFIMNPEQDADLAGSSQQAITFLKNERGTDYEVYLEVYNTLKSAYNELWDIEAQKRFKQDYKSLPIEQKKEIRKDIPLVISEAEPTDIGH